MNCPICNKEFKSYIEVSCHFRKSHGTSKELFEILKKKYIEENHNGIEPLCACGCGQVTTYKNYMIGYRKTILGHQARIINYGWGHNKKALEKSQEVRREMHKRGEIKYWCKGLTKETDERIAKAALKQSITRSSPEKIKEYSERMRKYRLDGTIPTLRGEAHSQWKGGTSSLQQLVRSYIHNAWSYPKMKESEFTCKKCGRNKSIQVHHDGERFAEILKEGMNAYNVINANELEYEEKVKIAEWVVEYHIENDVSGIVLCEDCHKQEHEKRS